MKAMEFVRIFHSIDTVLYIVVELRSQGYAGSDLVAFSREQDNISMLRDNSVMELRVHMARIGLKDLMKCWG